MTAGSSCWIGPPRTTSRSSPRPRRWWPALPDAIAERLSEAPSRTELQRILIVSDAWRPQVNGVVRTMSTVQDELVRMGRVVDVIGPDRFPTAPMPTYPDIRLALLPGRRLAKLIEAFKPDALHVSTEGPLGMAARRWAIRNGARFTTAFHTRFAEYLHARARVPVGLSYRWLRHFHRPSAGVMAATASLREDLVARGFERVRPWTRGVNLDQFRLEPREAWPFPRPVFLYVGRVAVEKNLPAFLSLDLPGSKVVVGDGPARAALARAYPAAHFAGPLADADLARAYAGADAFVFPSLTDTFGLVLLESLACGTPVAAFPVTGPKDILAGATAHVGAADTDLRAAALRALDARRQDCRAYAEGFSWRACAELFLGNLAPIRGTG